MDKRKANGKVTVNVVMPLKLERNARALERQLFRRMAPGVLTAALPCIAMEVGNASLFESWFGDNSRRESFRRLISFRSQSSQPLLRDSRSRGNFCRAAVPLQLGANLIPETILMSVSEFTTTVRRPSAAETPRMISARSPAQCWSVPSRVFFDCLRLATTPNHFISRRLFGFCFDPGVEFGLRS